MTDLLDSVFLQKGRSVRLTGYTSSLDLGGVQIGLLRETFQESEIEPQYNPLDPTPFKDITGSFEILLQGPTTSGIFYFTNLIRDIVITAEDYYNNRGTIASQILFNTDYAILKNAKFSIIKADTIPALKTVRIKIDYTRKPIIGSYTSYGSETDYRVFQPFPTDYTNQSNDDIPEPYGLRYTIQNMRGIFPSGYILASNMPIITMSGSTLFTSTYPNGEPAGVLRYNENYYNAYSQYGSSPTGVFGWTPSVGTSLITTSGVFYGNGSTGATSTYPYYTQADVYMTAKQTYSGTPFYVSFIAESANDNAANYTTDEIEVLDTIYPTIFYLGRVYADRSLSEYNYRLRIRASGVPTLSGTLQIDSIVVHPITDISSNAVFVSKLNTFVNTRYTPETAPSGTVGINIEDNYFYDNSTIRSVRFSPTATIFRTLSTNDTFYGPATYKGSIAFYKKRHEVDRFLTINSLQRSTIWSIFMAVGSAYDTVSGLNYWTLSDRFNNRARIRTVTTNPAVVYLNPGIA